MFRECLLWALEAQGRRIREGRNAVTNTFHLLALWQLDLQIAVGRPRVAA